MERIALEQIRDKAELVQLPPPAIDDPPQPSQPVLPPAEPARMKGRHAALVASFLCWVLLPVVALQWYMHNRAADQYSSTVAFTVRTEDAPMGLEVLSFVTAASGGNTTNADILYEFIGSQQLVAAIDDRLDLASIYSKPRADPLFAYDPSGSIEDLVAYWDRMVKVSFEADTGLLEVRTLAFDAQDAQNIAQAIFDESSIMINNLSAAAQKDATAYAAEELETSVTRLKDARQALTTFRSENQLVDPAANLSGQMGVLSSLQQQLAEAMIAHDLLTDVTRASDPRIEQSQRRIEAIEARIVEERQKLSSGSATPGDGNFTEIVGRFEELTVDREFAEQSYLSARASYDAALAEARRKSIYLAAYIEPTLAEASKYPKRGMIVGLTLLFIFLTWSIGTLIYYSVRDRQ